MDFFETQCSCELVCNFFRFLVGWQPDRSITTCRDRSIRLPTILTGWQLLSLATEVECRKTTRFATSCQLFEFLKYINYLFKLRNLFLTLIDQVDNMENFEFSNENVINLVQNEPAWIANSMETNRGFFRNAAW